MIATRCGVVFPRPEDKGQSVPGEHRRRRRVGGVALEWLNDPEIWASLVTLTALEIVLGHR